MALVIYNVLENISYHEIVCYYHYYGEGYVGKLVFKEKLQIEFLRVFFFEGDFFSICFGNFLLFWGFVLKRIQKVNKVSIK